MPVAEEMSATAEELAAQAEQLQSSMEFFKTRGRQRGKRRQAMNARPRWQLTRQSLRILPIRRVEAGRRARLQGRREHKRVLLLNMGDGGKDTEDDEFEKF